MRIFIVFTLCLLTFTSFSEIRYSYFADENYHTFEEIKIKDFKTLETGSINLGFDYPSCWLRIDFIDEDLKDKVLFSQCFTNDTLIAYIEGVNRSLQIESFGTLSKPKNGVSNLKIDLDNNCKTIWIQITSHSFIIDDFIILPEYEYRKNTQAYSIFLGIVFGVFLIMFFYNISVYFRVKEPAHLYYALFIICMLLLNSYAEGYGIDFIWSIFPKFNLVVEPMSSGIGILSLSLYASRVFNDELKSSFFKKSLIFWSFFGGLIIISSFFLPSRFMSQVANGCTMLLLLTVFGAAIYSWKKKNKYAKYFILGWLVFMIGVSGRVLYNAGVIPYSVSIHIIHHIGSILEAFVFTWVISQYLNVARVRDLNQSILLKKYSDQLDELKLLLKNSVRVDKPLDQMEGAKLNIDLSNYLITPLSNREIEVLQELSKGLTYQQIADELYISKSTVKTHLVSIYAKLEVANRTEAINKARNLNIA